MNLAVRYYTRSGNTETLARAIEEAVGAPAERVAVPLPEKADILFLGCSCYAFDVDEAVKRFIFENDGNTEVYYLKNASAVICSFTEAPKTITF